MKATILHDEHGKIIAVSKSPDLKRVGSKFSKVGMIPGRDQLALDVELTEELAKLPLLELHEGYRVDRATSKLVKATTRH